MLKSMGEVHFRTPTPPKPLNRFRCHVKYITTSPQGVDVQNLFGIDSVVTDLRVREKNTFYLSNYLSLSIYLSVCLSVSSPRLQVTVLGRFLRLIIVKKLNSLKHLVRTTVAESHN